MWYTSIFGVRGGGGGGGIYRRGNSRLPCRSTTIETGLAEGPGLEIETVLIRDTANIAGAPLAHFSLYALIIHYENLSDRFPAP